MKTIEKIDLENRFCDELWRKAHSSFAIKFFDCAIKIGIFDHLVKDMTLHEIAGVLDLDPTTLNPFLDVLVSLGLLDKQEDKYTNSKNTELFLKSTSPLNHTMAYQSFSEKIQPVLDSLEEILRYGPEIIQEKMQGDSTIGDQEVWGRLARSMEGSGMHQAQLILPYLLDLPEWETFTKMMDLGGGPGSHCLYFVSEHPYMQGVVFDQKEVAVETEKIIKEYGMEDRVKAVSGDYLKDDDLGSDYDFIWCCATLYFAKGQLTPLFQKVLNSLAPGGVFASFHPSISQTGRESWEMVVNCAPFAMTGMDMNFYGNEIADALIEAGFQTVQSRYLSTFFGTQRLDIARKVV